MARGRSGFTIIELMIVITVIVIIALIAVPSMISGRLAANEVTTIQTLRSIATAQQQFRQSAKADEDLDGTGEFGGLGELSGAVGVRGGATKVPTDLTGSMRTISVQGEVTRSGYVYRMYLPLANGHGQREPAGGGYGAGVVHSDNSEVVWACYAWPIRYSVTGRRAFCVNQQGDITFTDSAQLNGVNCGALTAGSAFLGPDPQSIMGRLAIGTAGADGNIWRAVQ
jgi:prepilin-type N-terminal cleavage/methylation domain-containing protein